MNGLEREGEAGAGGEHGIGPYHGIHGALTEDLIDTSQESAAAIARLKHTPAGAFGSARYQLPGFAESRAPYDRLMAVFQAHDIGYFFYNGGGDSADTCLKVAQVAEQLGYPLDLIHIPKTVDNDLPITDCCPGFGSVAKYIAVSTLEASYDVRSMAKTSTKVFVIEVMGRHAGWIAAAGGLVEDHGIPVVILFPEIEFDQKKFLARVDKLVKEHGYCTVVVSEGCHYPDGTFLAEQGTRDAFGHAQLGGAAPVVANMIKDALGHKFHWAVADYLQRAARHIASKTDVKQAYELGKKAVELAIKGHNSVMPTVERISDVPYKYKIGMADLKDVANVEKFMPRDFITKDGFGITPKCKRYLTPLIQGEDYPKYQDGLPVYVTLKNVAVAKKLAAFKL